MGTVVRGSPAEAAWHLVCTCEYYCNISVYVKVQLREMDTLAYEPDLVLEQAQYLKLG